MKPTNQSPEGRRVRNAAAIQDSISSLLAFRKEILVNLRASLENGWAAPTSDGSGLKPSESFASFDPASACLKTRQRSLALNLDGPSQEYSVKWPESGMMCCGESFQQPPWVRDICENGSASLLPTPTTRDYKDTPGMQTITEDGRKRLDQLPRMIFADESTAPTGGMKLTPEFQCWLMGYPPSWLKPLRDALATP